MRNLIKTTLALLFFSASPLLANDIYITQVGDDLDLDIVQDGQNNVIGTAQTDVSLTGDGMTFSITQTGNTNSIAAIIKGVNYTGTWAFTGNSNTVDLKCSSASTGDCDDVTLNITTTGDTNDYKVYIGENNDSEDLIAAFSVTGDGNEFDVDVDGKAANLTVTVNNSSSVSTTEAATTNATAAAGGNAVEIDMTGDGDSAGHTVDLTITGGGTAVEIDQSGIYDNHIDLSLTGDDGDVNITQSD